MTRVHFTMSSPHIYTFPPCREFFSFFLWSVQWAVNQSGWMRSIHSHFPSNPDSTILVVEYLPIYVHTFCLLWRIIPSSSRRQIIYRISTYIFFPELFRRLLSLLLCGLVWLTLNDGWHRRRAHARLRFIPPQIQFKERCISLSNLSCFSFVFSHSVISDARRLLHRTWLKRTNNLFWVGGGKPKRIGDHRLIISWAVGPRLYNIGNPGNQYGSCVHDDCEPSTQKTNRKGWKRKAQKCQTV